MRFEIGERIDLDKSENGPGGPINLRLKKNNVIFVLGRGTYFRHIFSLVPIASCKNEIESTPKNK